MVAVGPGCAPADFRSRRRLDPRSARVQSRRGRRLVGVGVVFASDGHFVVRPLATRGMATPCARTEHRARPMSREAYSPGTGDITVWKGFQRSFAVGLQLQRAGPYIAVDA